MPDWLLILLLLLSGFTLLLVELLIIPGFGFIGISGLVALGAGIYLSYVKLNPWVGTIISIVSLLLLVLFLRAFPKTGFWKRLRLETKEEKRLGFQASSEELKKFLGKEGYSITPLRPSGTALIEGARLDVVSEGVFLEKNTRVKVVMVEGNRVLVEKV
jgi:membrane-bound serine protease (ClpP class)